MSRIQEARHAAETAAQRRAHLSTRALLAGVTRAGACLVRLSVRLRGKLDATGGAHDLRAAG